MSVTAGFDLHVLGNELHCSTDEDSSPTLMKQLLLRKGRVAILDAPAPAISPKNVLVEVCHSLISTGTEMASVNLSGASLLTKAKERPQEVAKVLSSIRVRGLRKTLALVQRARIDRRFVRQRRASLADRQHDRWPRR